MRGPGEGSTRARSLQARLVTWSLVGICVLVMLPRLASANFGLLDDGRTITMAERIGRGDFDLSWDRNAGRFRPMYWAFPAVVYSAAGPEPLCFFAANLIALATTVLLIMWIVRRRGGSGLAAWLAGASFALSGPALEAYYTLSKGEVFQVLMLVAALAVMDGLRTHDRRSRLVGTAALTTAILFLAYCVKETSLAMFPISLGWWLVERLRSRRAAGGERLTGRGVFLMANLLAASAYLTARGVFLGGAPNSGDYTFRYAFDLDGLVSSGIRWAGWLVRDFPYLIPMGLAAAALPLGRRVLLASREMVEAAIWVVCWTVVFLPWPWTDEYYLLPCAVGVAWMMAAMTDAVRAGFGRSSASLRPVASAFLLLAALGFAVTVPNSLTSARIQLAVDDANAEMIESVARELPQRATLLVNLQNPREYFDQIGIHLHELQGRPDIEVVAYQGQGLEGFRSGSGKTFLLAGRIEGEPYFTVRIGIDEADVRRWNTSLEANLPAGARAVFETTRRFDRVNLEIPAVLCPLAPGKAFCAEPRPFFERETFIYGWCLYVLPDA